MEEEPQTPSLRAEPILLVAPTYHYAQKMARALCLDVREWRHVTEMAHVRGLRHARYFVCPWGVPWGDSALEVIIHLKNPAYGFVHLTEGRVKNLILRDRALASGGTV